MTKTEKMKYNNATIKAVYSMGLVGLEILDIIYGIEDYIIYKYTGDNSIHKSKVYYNSNNTYFRFYNYRISLNNCLRV